MTIKLSTNDPAWNRMRMVGDLAYKSLYATYLAILADPAQTVSQELHDLAEDWQEDMDEDLASLSGTRWEVASAGLYARVIPVINAVVDADIEA